MFSPLGFSETFRFGLIFDPMLDKLVLAYSTMLATEDFLLELPTICVLWRKKEKNCDIVQGGK